MAPKSNKQTKLLNQRVNVTNGDVIMDYENDKIREEREILRSDSWDVLWLVSHCHTGRSSPRGRGAYLGCDVTVMGRGTGMALNRIVPSP